MSRRSRMIRVMGLGPQWTLPRAIAPAELAAATPPAQATAAFIPAPSISSLPDSAITAPQQPPTNIGVPVARVELAAIAPAAHKPLIDTESLANLDWHALQQRVRSCRACTLCDTRRHTVFARGNPQAKLMIIGEAPGENEDRQGLPFVGKAGQLLDNMLHAIGINSETDSCITNIIKCRPPGNRNPAPEEIAACSTYLARQIELAQPKVIFAVGRFAMQTLLNSQQTVGALRGKLHHYQQIPLVVSYHPAYLLRNLPEKAKAWQDLQLLQQQLSVLD